MLAELRVESIIGLFMIREGPSAQVSFLRFFHKTGNPAIPSPPCSAIQVFFLFFGGRLLHFHLLATGASSPTIKRVTSIVLMTGDIVLVSSSLFFGFFSFFPRRRAVLPSIRKFVSYRSFFFMRLLLEPLQMGFLPLSYLKPAVYEGFCPPLAAAFFPCL